MRENILSLERKNDRISKSIHTIPGSNRLTRCNTEYNKPEQSYPLDNMREAILATTEQTRRRAWELLYEVYTAQRYAEPNEQGLWYSIHEALVDAVTITVTEKDEVVGTVSVYPESPLGYPAEDLYEAEIDRLCSMGRSPVEIGGLAVSTHSEDNSRVLTALFNLLWLYSRCLLGASDLIITVNPKHKRFYERTFLFEQIGEEKAYCRVKGAPAVLMRLDLDLPKNMIRWEHGEGPMPRDHDGHHTMYKLFPSQREDNLRVAWLRRTVRPLDYETIRRYFVEERPLIPEAPYHVQEYFWDSYCPDRLSMTKDAGHKFRSHMQ